MSHDLDNVHRSARRWLSLVLPSPPWSVSLEEGREALPDDDRPVAIVTPVGNMANLFARGSAPQGDVHRQLPMSMALYPEVADERRAGRLAAADLSQLVLDAISIGLVKDDGSNLCLPLTMPLWNYEGVPITGATRAGPADPFTFMEVEDPVVTAIPDPEDDRRWSVQVTFRATWWTPGRIVPGPVTGSMPPGAITLKP